MPEAFATHCSGFLPCGCLGDPSFAWLCIQTECNSEVLADQHLRRLGLCTWLPLHLSNKKIRPLFPRYLFAQADLSADLWRSIYRTPGVVTVLGTHNLRPTPVPTASLATLWTLCAPNGVIYPPEPKPAAPLLPIEVGSKLRLVEGLDVTGVCQWSNAKRVRLLMTIMGRQVPVTVDRAAVELA